VPLDLLSFGSHMDCGHESAVSLECTFCFPLVFLQTSFLFTASSHNRGSSCTDELRILLMHVVYTECTDTFCSLLGCLNVHIGQGHPKDPKTMATCTQLSGVRKQNMIALSDYHCSMQLSTASVHGAREQHVAMCACTAHSSEP
jgi:hypothetical protein